MCVLGFPPFHVSDNQCGGKRRGGLTVIVEKEKGNAAGRTVSKYLCGGGW
jgi:hypothetical protein